MLKIIAWEVYRRICVQGVTFSATLTRHRKTKFSFHISNDIPPQIRILNTVVPQCFLIIVYLFIFTMTPQDPTFEGSF